MLGIGDYLWRLIPANPILLRVVEAGGKRRRDLLIRCGYLGLLVFLVIFSLLTSGGAIGTGSLSELAKVSASIFQQMSYLQLALVALLAPIFTAGAITQEKDSQTYDILLATPLTNGQIVLGSLLSRLFFVIALLISGIPIFSITQIFGGVAIKSIALSFGIAAATAFVTGALAMAIAVFKVGTRRTIFSFYLFIVIYLVGVYLLDRLEVFHALGLAAGQRMDTSWLTGLHPFLALRVIFNDPAYIPPELGSLPAALQRWPLGWYLSSPQTFYISFMFFLSAVLILPSIVLLRRLAQSTISYKAWVLEKLRLGSGERRRRPRVVWFNPIAWREAKTKASAARATLLRYGFMAAGLIGALIVVVLHAQVEPVNQYVARGSYDPVLNTLAVISGERATTYPVDRETRVTLNNESVSLDRLHGGRYAVDVEVSGNRLTAVRARDIPRRLTAPDARTFLLGLVIIELAVILLIVTNAAASAVTREKEDGSLDLLLTTPITSHYYIWGKLRGLVSYVLPLAAVPVASIGLFILYDIWRRFRTGDPNFQWVIFPEAVLVMPAMIVIVAALASIIGMHMSLRCRTTVRAVMSSVGIVAAVCGLLGWCGYGVLQGGSEFGLIVGSFSPFTLLTLLIDPYTFADKVFTYGRADQVTGGRLLIFFFSYAAVAAYAAIVWWMYKSMVTNFDMTIRRQSM